MNKLFITLLLSFSCVLFANAQTAKSVEIGYFQAKIKTDHYESKIWISFSLNEDRMLVGYFIDGCGCRFLEDVDTSRLGRFDPIKKNGVLVGLESNYMIKETSSPDFFIRMMRDSLLKSGAISWASPVGFTNKSFLEKSMSVSSD